MIHTSIIFATEAHGKQLRKGTQLPYIIHPLEVAQILSYIHSPQEVIVAGILHDTLEDTLVTYQELVDHFGKNIASLVFECSNKCDGPWRTRKQYTITKLETTQNQKVALILCADKISNLRSITYDVSTTGPDVWKRFSAPKEDVLWYYEQLGKVIARRHDLPPDFIQEYTALYQKLQNITN